MQRLKWFTAVMIIHSINCNTLSADLTKTGNFVFFLWYPLALIYALPKEGDNLRYDTCCVWCSGAVNSAVSGTVLLLDPLVTVI